MTPVFLEQKLGEAARNPMGGREAAGFGMEPGTQARRPLAGCFAAAEDATHAPAGLMAAGERLLSDAVERACRRPRNKIVLVLHLSQLAPPAPLPHHVRVARAILQDSAHRFDGQVFTMGNRDLVLLCSDPREAPREDGASMPKMLQAALARLFASERAGAARLTSVWRLDADLADFYAFLASCAAEQRKPLAWPEEVPASVAGLMSLDEAVESVPLGALMTRDIGITLNPDRSLHLAARLVPSFRRLGVSLAGLHAAPATAGALGDPFFFRHLASKLELRLLQFLHNQLRAEQLDGPSTFRPAVFKVDQATHIELSPGVILSPHFESFARLVRSSRLALGIEMSLLQVCDEVDLLERVRRVLLRAGFSFILGPLDGVALSLCRPAGIAPDLVKIVWSQRLADGLADARGRMAGLLAQFGPERVVLQGVDSAHAMAWGQSRGFRFFQGAYLDHVRAATRMASCHGAASCSLRQCTARGGSWGEAGRAGCTNPGLLDGDKEGLLL